MTFVSISFVIFIIVALVAYYIAPKGKRWIILLICSMSFYIFADPKALLYVLFTCAVVYFCSMKMQAVNYVQQNMLKDKTKEWLKENKKQITQSCKAKKKRYLIFSLICTLGMLFAVKYLPMISSSAILLFKLNNVLPINILMTLGLSFYTFQSIGYLIDIYYSKVTAEKNLGKLLLFISFFPQIIQGPISKASQLLPQLIQGNDFNFKEFTYGAQLVAWGLIKKLIVADILISFSSPILSSVSDFDGSVVFAGLVVSYIQIYGDFSGGIDIARGVSHCFGITLTQNFKQPFFATSLIDYWRRWHVSLGVFMRDYVMMPLNLSKFMVRVGKFARNKFGVQVGKLFPIFVSTFFIFFLVGVWHGPNMKYVLFGLFNGLITSIETLYFNTRKKKEYSKVVLTLRHAIAIGYTAIIVFFANLLSMSADVNSITVSIHKMIFDFNSNALSAALLEQLDVGLSGIIIALMTFIVVLFVDLLKERGTDIRDVIAKQHVVLRYMLWTALFLFLIIYSSYGSAQGGFAYAVF